MEEQQRSVTLNEIKKISNICHVGGSCSRIIIIFNPDRTEQMLSYPTFMQRAGCSVSRPCIWSFYGILHSTDQKSTRNRKPACVPWKYGWGICQCFKYTRSKIGAYLGEVIGTGILGGMLCYPIASMMMGQKAALFTFVGPFLASTLCGTVIAAVIITALYKSKAVRLIENI